MWGKHHKGVNIACTFLAHNASHCFGTLKDGRLSSNKVNERLIPNKLHLYTYIAPYILTRHHVVLCGYHVHDYEDYDFGLHSLSNEDCVEQKKMERVPCSTTDCLRWGSERHVSWHYAGDMPHLGAICMPRIGERCMPLLGAWHVHYHDALDINLVVANCLNHMKYKA
ncbi:hypothetical protein VNO78_11521 [Psophocarpus tetragonolobus]|uniref:Uncharacterized protein n=1 Tax=Psophocarpus tetragonolobus TaxID=3891 RepID=A0AAN9XNS0_PSOTE